MDFRPVGFIIGWLVIGLGVMMVLPMALDYADGSGNAGAFLISMLLTVTAGATVAVACAEAGPPRLDNRQGFMLTTAAWLAFTAASTLPLMLGAPHLGFTDAFFETMSAMTTTGATVIGGLESLPRGALLWRGLLQWVGGIGVILVAMILLPVLGIGGMQLLRIADFNTLGKVMPRAKEIALSITLVYVALTLACALGFIWSGMSGFDGIVYAMTTLATGGMGNYDSSFAGFSPAAQYVATVFMLLGAMSFIRFVQFARGDHGALRGDSQIRAFLAIYAAFVVAIVAARAVDAQPLDERTLREVLFNLASVITTTGFASTDFNRWSSLALALIFCSMMICGCSGSTAGGPKVFRYQLLAAAISAEVKRLYSPNVVFTPRYQGRPVSDEVMESVMGFFMLYFLSLAVGSVLLVMLGLDVITAITGMATCLGNIGPGFGPIIGPAGNFAPLPDAAKWVLAAAMLIGRLEIMSVFVLLTPVYWRA